MKVRVTRKWGIPVRSKRGHNAEIVGKMAYGEECEVVDEFDNWVYIEGLGWCDARHTEPVEFGGGGIRSGTGECSEIFNSENNKAPGSYSHAEGNSTTASGDNSHAEGTYTIAASRHQHVQGKYNLQDIDNKYAHIVGNGESVRDRSNAHTLDWDGNAWFAGGIELTSPNGM